MDFDLFAITKVKNVITPQRNNFNDSELFFYIPENYNNTIIKPSTTIKIEMGIKMLLPINYCIFVNGINGLIINQTINQNNIDEVKLFLTNGTENNIELKFNEPVAYGLLLEVGHHKPYEVDNRKFQILCETRFNQTH